MKPKKHRITVSPEKARAAAMGCYTGTTPAAEHHRRGSCGKDRTGNKSSGGTGATCEVRQRTAKSGE